MNREERTSKTAEDFSIHVIATIKCNEKFLLLPLAFYCWWQVTAWCGGYNGVKIHRHFNKIYKCITITSEKYSIYDKCHQKKTKLYGYIHVICKVYLLLSCYSAKKGVASITSFLCIHFHTLTHRTCHSLTLPHSTNAKQSKLHPSKDATKLIKSLNCQ